MKRSDLSSQIKEMIVDVLSEVSQDDVAAAQAYNAELEKTKELSSDLGLTEDDEEPTSKDIKKSDSISTISRKLQDTNKEMKSLVNKWKKSEGKEKEQLLVRLKDLTKIKKELEGLV
jgi:hypothetical protein|tara:strand:+ start:215 stop:565 length:351 start_codon:yes stop_codon:yes gene_type:complete